MSDAAVQVPASLDLLDVAGNGMDCERFLWIQGLNRAGEGERLARIDLLDQLHRFPGELLHVAASDGASAAQLFTLVDDDGRGACYLRVYARNDPGEPVLGDLVALASDRARAGGADVVSAGGDPGQRPFLDALVARHEFHEHERWRRFHLDLGRVDEPPVLPDGLHATTLAERGELAAGAFRVYREGLEDTPGDFPRPAETLESWLRDLDGSPILGRDLLVVVHDDADDVVAMVELERLAADSRRASVEFLAVDRALRGRGIAAAAKRAAAYVGAREGLERLVSVNHETNEAICRLNTRLGWTEDPRHVNLRRSVSGT